MKMVNKATSEAVYYNPVRKAGKGVWVPHTGPHAPLFVLALHFPYLYRYCLPFFLKEKGVLFRSLIKSFHYKKKSPCTGLSGAVQEAYPQNVLCGIGNQEIYFDPEDIPQPGASAWMTVIVIGISIRSTQTGLSDTPHIPLHFQFFLTVYT